MNTKPCILYIVILFTSLNSSAQWQKLNAPTTYTTCFAGSEANIYVGTADTGILFSADNGNNWIILNMGVSNLSISSIAVNEDNIYAGTYGKGCYYSYDSGTSWSVVDTPVSWIDAIMLSEQKVFLGSNDKVVLSLDSGANWVDVSNGITPYTSFTSFEIIDGNIFTSAQTTFLASGGVFLSTDNGFTWTQVGNGLFPNVSSLAVMGENLFAGTYGGGGVFVSSDSGMNWTPINSGQNWGFIRGLAVSGSNLFAASENDGIFLTTDMGITWTDVNTGLTNTNIHVIAVNDEYIFAKNTYGEIWRRSLSEVTSGVIDAYENKYSEVKIYPNPFMASATIEFENEKKEKCTLVIYNTTGQSVRKIENITNGSVKIERENLNSGLYFFQLTSNQERVRKGKLILN